MGRSRAAAPNGITGPPGASSTIGATTQVWHLVSACQGGPTATSRESLMRCESDARGSGASECICVARLPTAARVLPALLAFELALVHPAFALAVDGISHAGPVLGAAVLLGHVEQHLLGGQQAVAVTIHCLELGDGLAALAPLVQADLPVTVGVQLLEPRRQLGGELAGAVDHRPLVVILLGGRVLDAERGAGLAGRVARHAALHDRAVIGAELAHADQ